MMCRGRVLSDDGLIRTEVDELFAVARELCAQGRQIPGASFSPPMDSLNRARLPRRLPDAPRSSPESRNNH